MNFRWHEEKNKLLISKRGVSFEHAKELIENEQLLDVKANPNQEKYPEQWHILLEINSYVYVVVCYIREDEIFMITIYPSRKYTKTYLGGQNDKNSQ